jgi:hypothetical protein
MPSRRDTRARASVDAWPRRRHLRLRVRRRGAAARRTRARSRRRRRKGRGCGAPCMHTDIFINSFMHTDIFIYSFALWRALPAAPRSAETGLPRRAEGCTGPGASQAFTGSSVDGPNAAKRRCAKDSAAAVVGIGRGLDGARPCERVLERSKAHRLDPFARRLPPSAPPQTHADRPFGATRGRAHPCSSENALPALDSSASAGADAQSSARSRSTAARSSPKLRPIGRWDGRKGGRRG